MVSNGILQGLIIRIPHRLSEKYIRGSGKGYLGEQSESAPGAY